MFGHGMGQHTEQLDYQVDSTGDWHLVSGLKIEHDNVH